MTTKIIKTEAEWKAQLNEGQYDVLRNKGTERAFTGKYHDYHEQGVYVCAGCGAELFSSDAKFDSGTGWPSFFEPITNDCLATAIDESFGVKRIEVLCAACDGHLGHVFDDGPEPTRLRYCVNSISLNFKNK